MQNKKLLAYIFDKVKNIFVPVKIVNPDVKRIHILTDDIVNNNNNRLTKIEEYQHKD